MATGQTHGGKGSTTRPTDKKKYEDNWDAILDTQQKNMRPALYKGMQDEVKFRDSFYEN